MRVLVQILIVAGGIAVLIGAAMGFQTVFPALARVLRILANPFVLVGIVVIALLVRSGRPRRPPPAGPGPDR